MKTIKFGGIDYEIFINGSVDKGDVRVITVPQSILLQDIKKFDMNYLQEIVNDNALFTVA